MNNVQLSARVGLFFFLGIALIWVSFETLSDGRILEKRGYVLTTSFDNLKELKAGDDVRMAGVRIGSVSETRLEGARAVAVLLIDPTIAVPADSVATVSMAGLLGSNYIAITPGSPTAPPLQPGSMITGHTTADLNAVISQLGTISEQIEGVISQVSGAISGDEESPLAMLNRLLRENSDAITESLANIQDITGKIRNGEGTIGRLVNDPSAYDELVGSLAEIRGAAVEARALATDAGAIIAEVRTGQGTLGSLIFDGRLGEEIIAVAQNLRELSEKLNSGEGTLGRLLVDDGLYREAQSVLRKADRAMEGLGDQGPVTAAGVVINSLF